MAVRNGAYIPLGSVRVIRRAGQRDRWREWKPSLRAVSPGLDPAALCSMGEGKVNLTWYTHTSVERTTVGLREDWARSEVPQFTTIPMSGLRLPLCSDRCWHESSALWNCYRSRRLSRWPGNLSLQYPHLRTLLSTVWDCVKWYMRTMNKSI